MNKTIKTAQTVQIGYCRTSTKHQSISRQIRNIKEIYPDAIIVQEVFTGTTTSRPKWLNVMKMVEKGKVDTIIFDSVSRMSRSKEEGSKLYIALYNAGIRLIFLKEPYLNTDEYKKALSKKIDINIALDDTATEQLMQSFFNALNDYFVALATRQVELAFEQSEKEVMDLRQRTKEGLLSAKLNRGVQLGRKPGTTFETKKSKKCKKFLLQNADVFGGNLSVTECSRALNIARSTTYRYVNQILEKAGITDLNDTEIIKETFKSKKCSI